MEIRNLGKSDLRVSLIGLGCNNFGGRTSPADSRSVIHRALDCGITFFDTADIYAGRGGSESVLGEVLGDRRKDMVLSTKFGAPMDNAGSLAGGSHRYIKTALEASLKRLRTEWIDLYQLHVPDPLTPIEETLRALEDLVRQGKVRYLGCSNFAGWQIADAQRAAHLHDCPGFISLECEYSLLVRNAEKEQIPSMLAHGLGLLPYYPLASGLLTGKYQRGEAPAVGTRFATTPILANRFLSAVNLDRIDRLTRFAQSHGRSILSLALSWLATRPGVASIIAGATRPEQIDQNIEATCGWLTPKDLTEIDVAAQ